MKTCRYTDRNPQPYTKKFQRVQVSNDIANNQNSHRFTTLSDQGSSPRSQPTTYKPPILLLEDEAVRHDYADALKDIAAVDTVTDVASALTHLKTYRYVAAILDIRIGPDLQGGFHVADAFAEHSPETELIFNSAYYGEEDPSLFFERFATYQVFERKVAHATELRTAVLGAIRSYERAEQTRRLLEQIQLLGNSLDDILRSLVEKELHEIATQETLPALSFDDQFRFYQDAGFLYPEKLTALLPHYTAIKTTWDSMLAANNATCKTVIRCPHGIPKNAASAFAYTQSTWLAQHLASVERGDAIGTLSVLVGLFRFLHENTHVNFCRLTHIANHPAVRPLFAGLAQSLPPDLSHYQTYDWIIAPIDQLQTRSHRLIRINDAGHSARTQTFLREHLSPVQYKALDIENDPELTCFNSQLSRYGLTRARKIFTAIHDGDILGAVLCNTGSLGMNFSFHENSVELVLTPGLDQEDQECVFPQPAACGNGLLSCTGI